jgi:probable rRNA maturation factor
MLEIDVQYAVPRRGVPAAVSIRSWVEAALPATDRQPVQVSVRVVDEAESEALNRAYRNKRRPTNVLSFPSGLDDPALPVRPLGDLVICAPVVAREAMAQGKEIKAHWAHMCVHGVLHLLGYDHETESEAEAMEALEIRLMARLGYPDPYA